MGLSVSVVVPIGPGHETFAAEAIDTVHRAWRLTRGPFSSLTVTAVDDTSGRRGRSAARNAGVSDEPCDWYFFLDADDLMMPRAFSLVDLASPATFGEIWLNN